MSVTEIQVNNSPMNLVFILADNQSTEALAVYGNRDVETPNIDRLAAEGIRFDRVFAVNGLCSATRATLMSGLIPSGHGMHDAIPDPLLDRLPDDWNVVREYPTLPQILADSGYSTAMVGKWHLGQFMQPQIGYQYWVTFPYGHTLSFWDSQIIDNGESYSVKERHIVDVFTQKAVEFIEQQSEDKPFYLQLNYDGPYANPPSNYGPARNRHYNRYISKEFQDMPVEPVNDNILKRINGPWAPITADNLKEGGLSNMNIWSSLIYDTIRMQGDRESYANFLSQNSIVDDGVGLVLSALERKGLLDNTLIVYSADQGNHFGQHGTWGHTNWYFPTRLYDVAMRIPLIVRSPARETAGSVNSAMIGQYDFMPTLLAALNVPHEPHPLAPGRDFSPLFRGGRLKNWPKAVFFEQEETRGIRTADSLYWQRHPELGENVLFDLTVDPGQRHDVASEDAYVDARRQLDKQVTEFFERFSDPNYDLWKGGNVKGFSLSPWKWRKLYGEEWGRRPVYQKQK